MMKKLLAGLALVGLATFTYARDANAATTFKLGTVSSGSQGSNSSCHDVSSSEFWGFNPVVHAFDTTAVALPAGTYRAFLGASTTWRLSKSAHADDVNILAAGFVKAEVIEVMIFGNEVVRTAFVRGYSSNGQEFSDIPANQDLSSFVVSGNNGSKYKLRVTTWAPQCTKAVMSGVSVELALE